MLVDSYSCLIKGHFLWSRLTRVSLSSSGKEASDSDRLMMWLRGLVMLSMLADRMSVVTLSMPEAEFFKLAVIFLISCSELRCKLNSDRGVGLFWMYAIGHTGGWISLEMLWAMVVKNLLNVFVICVAQMIKCGLDGEYMILFAMS